MATVAIRPSAFTKVSSDGQMVFTVEPSVNATSAGCTNATLMLRLGYVRDLNDCDACTLGSSALRVSIPPIMTLVGRALRWYLPPVQALCPGVREGQPIGWSHILVLGGTCHLSERDGSIQR